MVIREDPEARQSLHHEAVQGPYPPDGEGWPSHYNHGAVQGSLPDDKVSYEPIQKERREYNQMSNGAIFNIHGRRSRNWRGQRSDNRIGGSSECVL